jgi:hypothetical protein
MKVGLFVTLETESRPDVSAHLAELTARVLAAKDAVFDSPWFPRHFVTGPSMRQFAASPIMGTPANLSGGMRMGTGSSTRHCRRDMKPGKVEPRMCTATNG